LGQLQTSPNTSNRLTCRYGAPRLPRSGQTDVGPRAIGTILDPNGPAIAMIKKNEAFYGDATILGKPYVTGYEPIKDASGNVIGVYYVGYLKSSEATGTSTPPSATPSK
jgi:hypothetical protein